MSTTHSIHSQPNLSVPISPSRADRVNAILIACLVMFGFLFSVLFVVWWFHEPPVTRFPPPPPKPTTPLLPLTDDVKLDVVEFETSPAKDFEELLETTTPSVIKFSTTTGPFGDGASNTPGIDWNPDPRIPRPPGVVAAQWKVAQEADDLESYQRKLDFFGIEIGAVHNTSDHVWRISELSTEKIVTASTRDAESTVRYFVNRKKRLQQWDRQTISQAGVELKDIIAVHFYPAELVASMQQLIDAKYGDQADDLQEITFKISGAAGDFRFEIADVKFDE